MNKLLSFLKTYKAIFFVVILGSLFLFILLTSSTQPPETQPIFPTPTIVPNRIVTPQAENSFIVDNVPEELNHKAWVFQLPLQNQFYYIEYYYPTGTIIARLYPGEPLFYFTTEDQTNGLKDEVQKKLQSLGADLTKEKIEWIIED